MRPRKQTEARGCRRGLGILEPAAVSAFSGVFQTCCSPFPKPPTRLPSPKLPICYSGYNSEANETAAAAEADGSPRKRKGSRNIRFPHCVQVYRCFLSFWSPVCFRTFRFTIFRNPPPAHIPNCQYRISDIIPKLTKPPLRSGRGRRRCFETLCIGMGRR